jgi:hypothetical protein
LFGSEKSAPEVTKQHPSEGFMHRLSRLDVYLDDHEIPDPGESILAMVPASSLSSSTDYLSHVDRMELMYQKEAVVQAWSEKVRREREKLRGKQARSEQVFSRLTQLSLRLGELHEEAVAITLKVSAAVQSPVEAAEVQRELLVQFKGDMIQRCRQGKGTKYSRIATNLAYDDESIQEIVIDEQSVYDSLHSELSEIAKMRKVPKSERLELTLGLLEDHILVISSSLDPFKLGFSFES